MFSVNNINYLTARKFYKVSCINPANNKSFNQKATAIEYALNLINSKAEKNPVITIAYRNI